MLNLIKYIIILSHSIKTCNTFDDYNTIFFNQMFKYGLYLFPLPSKNICNLDSDT
jgi:hypothetical protein